MHVVGSERPVKIGFEVKVDKGAAAGEALRCVEALLRDAEASNKRLEAQLVHLRGKAAMGEKSGEIDQAVTKLPAEMRACFGARDLRRVCVGRDTRDAPRLQEHQDAATLCSSTSSELVSELSPNVNSVCGKGGPEHLLDQMQVDSFSDWFSFSHSSNGETSRQSIVQAWEPFSDCDPFQVQVSGDIAGSHAACVGGQEQDPSNISLTERETADGQSAAIKCKFNPVDGHSVVSGKSAASAQVAPSREGVIDLRERSPASWHRRQFRVLVGDKGSATAVSSRLLFAEDDSTLSRMEEDEGKMSTPGCLGKLQAQLGTYAQRLQGQVLMAKECEPWHGTHRDGVDNS